MKEFHNNEDSHSLNHAPNRNMKNKNHHSTIKEEDEEEESPADFGQDKEHTGVFSIMTDRQIQSGLK